jgi:rhodanese-related sulfurtransferase
MSSRLLRMTAIVALGAALGLLWSAFSGRGLALTRNVFLREGDEVVGAVEARQRMQAGALFLDARPFPFYKMGHIPGALSLPEESFEAAFARLEPQLRSRFDIVVYCSGFGCEASHLVARALKQRGIPAAILGEGWPAWQEAGYPERSGDLP